MEYIRVKKLAAIYGEDITLKELMNHIKTRDKLNYICPKCKGAGVVLEEYDAYPKGLPDSGWATDIRTREIKCDLCKGQGYTEKEMKPKMVQVGWE